MKNLKVILVLEEAQNIEVDLVLAEEGKMKSGKRRTMIMKINSI